MQSTDVEVMRINILENVLLFFRSLLSFYCTAIDNSIASALLNNANIKAVRERFNLCDIMALMGRGGDRKNIMMMMMMVMTLQEEGKKNELHTIFDCRQLSFSIEV